MKVAGSFQREDIAGIAQKSISYSGVVSNFQTMVSDAELVPTKNVIIVNLYIRVCSFSLAKHIIQDFKSKAKLSKGMDLRKEIQSGFKEQTQGRHN